MRIAVCLLLICTLARAAWAAEPVERSWKVDGVERRALVYPPTRPSRTDRPLIFAFHGHGGNMRQAARKFGYQDLWPEALVVYMQGLPTPGALTDPQGLRNGWQRTTGDQGDRDLKFFDSVMVTVTKEYRIDRRRVFATGHSNGGGFTYLLWAARGSTFAAVAPCAALAGVNQAALKPKPALHVAGERDPLVRFAWQQRCMEAVRKINGCDESGSPWAKSPGAVTTIYRSKRGTPFVSVVYPGGHALPDEVFPLVVKFFKEHTSEKLPAETAP